MATEARAALSLAPSTRVLLVDEEPVVRAGLRILIESWPGLRVVADVDGVADAKAAFSVENGDARPDLILFSHAGRAVGSLESLRELLHAVGETPVVLLTDSRDPNVGAQALEWGARWVVLKRHAAADLRQAIERVRFTKNSLDKTAIATLVAQIYKQNRTNGNRLAPEETLTNREREVAVLVSKGCTNRQVGKRLGITEVTVRHHLTSIFGKLRIANRFELIVWLYRQGVVRPGDPA